MLGTPALAAAWQLVGANDSDRALRLPVAGEPQLRQLLRDPTRGRRDPGRPVHAAAARCHRRLRQAVPPRGRRDHRPGPHHARPRCAVQRRPDGRLRLGQRDAGPRRQPGHGLLRRPRPALLLERRRRVRALRPLLQLVEVRQRAQPHVRRDRPPGSEGAVRADPGRGLGRPPDHLRPAGGSRHQLEVLRRELRPDDHLPDPRGREGRRPRRAGHLGAAARLRPLRRRPRARVAHRRPGRVLRRRGVREPAGRVVHGSVGQQRAPAGQHPGRDSDSCAG